MSTKEFRNFIREADPTIISPHMTWLKAEERLISYVKYCLICCNDASKIYVCDACYNHVCLSCSIKLNKCPTCRENYHFRNRTFFVKEGYISPNYNFTFKIVLSDLCDKFEEKTEYREEVSDSNFYNNIITRTMTYTRNPSIISPPWGFRRPRSISSFVEIGARAATNRYYNDSDINGEYLTTFNSLLRR